MREGEFNPATHQIQPESPYFKERNLKLRIFQLKNHALEKTEHDKIWQQRQGLITKYSRGKLVWQKFQNVLAKIEEKIPSLRLQNVPDFQHAMLLAGASEEEALAITKHEADHFNAARNAGLDAELVIEFVYVREEKKGTNTASMHLFPSVAIKVSENISAEHLSQAISKIASAPENLSPGDINLLKNNC